MRHVVKKCGWCNWPTLIVLLALFAAIGTIGGCSTVQHDVRRATDETLASTGAMGIEIAQVDYRNVTLLGPTGQGQDALRAVESLKATHEVVYEGFETSSSSTSTSLITTTTVAPGPAAISIDGTMANGVLTLTGSVPDDATRTQLLDRAAAAYGQDNVVNQLSAQGVASTMELAEASTGLGNLFEVFAQNLQSGSFRLEDTVLTVAGTAMAASTTETSISSATGFTSIQATVRSATSQVADDTENAIADELRLHGITFESSSSTITSDSSVVLDKIADIISTALKKQPDLRIQIAGYTDSSGNASANQQLSQERANAVLDYLTGKGIPANVFTAMGFGSADPIASNDTPEGRAENRRIEFTVEEG